MNGGTRKMDYNKETEKLNSGQNTWKPETGVYKVIIVDEPEETVFVDGDGKETEQIKLNISLGDTPDDQYTWYVSRGLTTKSLYGQLMVIGQRHGKLAGRMIELIVNETKNRSGKTIKMYTIGEAVKILAELEKVNKELKDQVKTETVKE